MDETPKSRWIRFRLSTWFLASSFALAVTEVKQLVWSTPGKL
jgi:hypothetical protein